MGAACPGDAFLLEEYGPEEDRGIETLGDALLRYKAHRPQRELEEISAYSPISAAQPTPPPQARPARDLDDHGRQERWREEVAKKQKQVRQEDGGMTEEEAAEALEDLIHRLEHQKVCLETTGHQKHFIEEKAMDAHGRVNSINHDEIVMPDIRSLMESLDQQNSRLGSLYQGPLMREYDHEADSETLALENEREEMTATSLDVSLPLDRDRREHMVSLLFQKFDMDCDGILSKEELMHLAQSLAHDPFDGSPEDWDGLYQDFVREIGEPVDLERFARLVDTALSDDNPLELTDDQIVTMIGPEEQPRELVHFDGDDLSRSDPEEWHEEWHRDAEQLKDYVRNCSRKQVERTCRANCITQ